MLYLLRAEHLKFKRTMSRKLLVVLPVLLLGMLIVLSGNYFEVNGFNWWYTFMYPGLLAILSAMAVLKDGQKRRFQNLYAQPYSIKKIIAVKTTVISGYGLIACGILMIGILLTAYCLPSVKMFTIGEAVSGMVLVFITSLWEIPLCLILARRAGFFTALLVNMAGTVLGVVMAPEWFWFFNPWAYTSRVVCPVLEIAPNNLLIEAGDPLLSVWVIPVGIVLSTVLLIGLTYLAGVYYERKEV